MNALQAQAFPHGLSQPPYSKAGLVPRALLPRRLEVSEEPPQTQCWEGRHKSQPPSSTTGLHWHHMLHNIVPLHTERPVFSAPGCRTAVSPGAVLSLFSLFYYFSGNSNQCNHAWCTGWKMVSPSPSSFNLMNCLFSYERVMSTKPRNSYSRNKRRRHGRRAGSSHGSRAWREGQLDVLQERLPPNPSDTGINF